MSNRPGPRPDLWISGPDPRDHVMHTAWNRQRSQARFRSEPWDLSWPEWREIWDPHWEQRGRHPHNVCMVRIDSDLGWTKANVEIVSRLEQLARQPQKQPGYTRPQRTKSG